jgi:hypothetical protein
MMAIQKEGLDLFRRKNADYGDAFASYGAIGVLVRIGDKIKRLMSISSTRIQMVNDESIYDTLLDLHNYAAMALMLMREERISSTEGRMHEDDLSAEEPATKNVSTQPSDGGGWSGDGVDTGL